LHLAKVKDRTGNNEFRTFNNLARDMSTISCKIKYSRNLQGFRIVREQRKIVLTVLLHAEAQLPLLDDQGLQQQRTLL
jgi:hypothetical protein